MALFEVQYDIEFIKASRSDDVDYDETKARQALRKENEKAEDDRDQKAIAEISERIAKSQAAKKELQQLCDLRDGLSEYIEML